MRSSCLRFSLLTVAFSLSLPLAPTALAQGAGRRFEQAAPKVGELMPNLQIYDADGKRIWLHDELRGHPSVLIVGCLT